MIDKDDKKQSFDVPIDFKQTVPQSISEIIKFLRVKYPIIQNARILSIIQGFKTMTVQKYRIYFYKELIANNTPSYQIYRAIVDYQKDTP